MQSRAIEWIGRVEGRVEAPGSKSATNRGLVIGALAEGETVLDRALRCDDTLALAGSLSSLGLPAAWDESRRCFRVRGAGGRIPAPAASLDAGASGTAFRFLCAVAALGEGEYRVGGVKRLGERPIMPLARAIESLGGVVGRGGVGVLPLVVRGRIRGGTVSVSGARSSQFASALLLVGPCLKSGLDVVVTGRAVSRPYLELTVEMMREFGARVASVGPLHQRVEPSGYRSRIYSVPGDESAASYFFAAGAVGGGPVRVTNLRRTSGRGDIAFLDLLERMGARVDRGAGFAEVTGGELRGIEVDLADSPDVVPTLAAVATRARGRTRIRGVAHLRAKESDRIRAVVGAVRALGGRAEELSDGVEVIGGGLGGGAVDPHGDHRIAMSFAVLGLVVPGISILDPACVAKSFPLFFEELERLGS